MRTASPSPSCLAIPSNRSSPRGRDLAGLDFDGRAAAGHQRVEAEPALIEEIGVGRSLGFATVDAIPPPALAISS